MAEFWYNVTTGKVEQGAHSSWRHLLGPYETYDEALRALERVHQRNEEWEQGNDDE